MLLVPQAVEGETREESAEKSAEGITLGIRQRNSSSGAARERLPVRSTRGAGPGCLSRAAAPPAPHPSAAPGDRGLLEQYVVQISRERHRASTGEPSAPRQPRLRRELLPGTSACRWSPAETGEQGRGESRRTVLVRHSWSLTQRVSDLLVPMLSLSPSLCPRHSLLAGRGQSVYPRKLLESQQHPCSSRTTHTYFLRACGKKPLPPTDTRG